jgi:histidine ammonia-lyase
MLNPADGQPLFAKAGIDQVSTAGSTVYRTKDAGAAKTVVDTFVAETQQDDSSFKPMTAPDGADYVKCLQNSLAAEYYCTAQYGRYAVELRAETEKDMASAVSAQGKLLAGF